MIKVFSSIDLPDPIPRDDEKALVAKLKARLSENVVERAPKKEKVDALNFSVERAFREYGLDCAYIGPYGIIPEKPEVSNPLVASIGTGCTDISIYKGVISTAFRLYGEHSIYVPSVHDLERQAPLSHHECRKGEQGPDMSELIIVLPKVHCGRSIVQECLDIDILRVNPFSEKGAAMLESVIVPYLRKIFPGDILYDPIEGVHVRPLERHD